MEAMIAGMGTNVLHLSQALTLRCGRLNQLEQHRRRRILSALSAIALKSSYDWRRLKSVTWQQDDLRGTISEEVICNDMLLPDIL